MSDYGIKSAGAVKLYSFSRIDQGNKCIVQAVDDLIRSCLLILLLEFVL